MSSRVQALEIQGTQQTEDEALAVEDDTASILTATNCNPPPMDHTANIFLWDTDFTEELQKSWVYRRNKAFRGSVISALTSSVYTTGWSFFSDLSMAEVSNISIINLAITRDEVFNPRRSSQTWPNNRIDAEWPLLSICMPVPQKATTSPEPVTDVKDDTKRPCKYCDNTYEEGRGYVLGKCSSKSSLLELGI